MQQNKTNNKIQNILAHLGGEWNLSLLLFSLLSLRELFLLAGGPGGVGGGSGSGGCGVVVAVVAVRFGAGLHEWRHCCSCCCTFRCGSTC